VAIRTSNPSIATWLAPSRLIAPEYADTLACLAFTSTPGSALNTIGLVAVPLVVIWKPVYVPARTTIMSPARALFAAYWSVRHGLVLDPPPLSVPLGDTYTVRRMPEYPVLAVTVTVVVYSVNPPSLSVIRPRTVYVPAWVKVVAAVGEVLFATSHVPSLVKS
jgi:hypothetical protein